MIQTFDSREGVKWVDEPQTIARSYLRGWFTLDILSLVPSAFDLIPLIAVGSGDPPAPKWRGCGTSRCLSQQDSSASIIARFKAFRVIRVCRLIKLTRLLRASRMLKRWETRMSLNYASLALLRVVFVYFIASHWAACVLLLPTTFTDSPMETWLGYYDYCVSEPQAVTQAFETSAANPLVESNEVSADEYALCTQGRGLDARPALAMARLNQGMCSVRCASTNDLYVAALYMALQLMSGTTGGEFTFLVYSMGERVIFSLLIVVGVLLWGHVIGTFVTVIGQYNPDLNWFAQPDSDRDSSNTPWVRSANLPVFFPQLIALSTYLPDCRFRMTMDALNNFMEINQLPDEMRMRLREYFQQTRHVNRGQQRRKLLSLMSPQLQGEVCMRMNSKWIDKVRFLRGAEKELKVMVAISLAPAVSQSTFDAIHAQIHA
jgi:hypothetical protein